MELLKKLTQINSVSGREKPIAQLINDCVGKYADEIFSDALGNLIVHKKGTGKRILFAAHMDEIGIMATVIEKDGFIRFATVGGVDSKTLLNKRVCFENGTIGVIGTEEDNKEQKCAKLYIDIGAKNAEEAQSLVSIGDMAAFEGGFVQSGARVISKALDNRVGCYALIKALEGIESKNDLYFVFTVQEEVGLRGAKTAAFDIQPDYAIAVDVTDTGDTPEAPRMAVKLGGGAAIKVMDRSVICDSGIRSDLIEIARENKIPYQLEVMTDGGTDAGAISLTRAGIKTGGISVPTRYIHSISEMADMGDIRAVIDLITLYAQI